MSRLTNGLIGLAILCLAAACGGDKALDSEQKAKLKELNTSSSSVLNSANAAKGNKRSALRTATTPTNSQMVDRMSSSECNFEEPTNISSTGMTMKISGDKCPIVMDWGIQTSGNEATVRMYFEIKDAELANLSDVTKYNLNGTFNKNGGQLTGSISSKKHGEVGLVMNVSGDEENVTIEVIYKFSDFEAKLTGVKNKDGWKYTLNGEELSDADYKAMSGEAGTAAGDSSQSSGDQSGTPNTTESSSSYSYDLTYNGCATGKHTFSTKEALCEGLQSTSLNKSCAETLRRSHFTSYSCSGTFTVKP